MTADEDAALRQLRAVNNELRRIQCELQARIDERERQLSPHFRYYDRVVNRLLFGSLRTFIFKFFSLRNKLPF